MARDATNMPEALTGESRVHIAGVGAIQHTINPQDSGGALPPANPQPQVTNRVSDLVNRLGNDVVLLPIRPGQKAPSFSGWQNTTLERMSDPAYLAEVNQSNIGVLLGKPSGGLCSIDIDSDGGVDPFLALNPQLRDALRTRGSRGANIWVRIVGDYPPLAKLKTIDGADWGEWRADRGQTVIDGTHPNGNGYQRLVDAAPAQVAFDEIVWPNNLDLPWEESPYGDLVEEYGEPYVESSGKITINHRFFVGRFKSIRHVLFESTENEFYGYRAESGLWHRETEHSVKHKFASDLKSAADEFGKEQIVYKITDTLTTSLKNMLKGDVEKRSVFLKQRGIIHVQNGMLNLNGDQPTLQPFDPMFYSRNQVPFAWDPNAQCPRFLNELLGPALSQEDISLLQRWCGSALLGVNEAQRLMILSGEGGTGKSTIAEIVEGIIGQQNVAALRTKHLSDRFELTGFLGKTLLTGKDVAGNFLNTEGAHVIKALSGGDLLDAEKKNAGRFQLRGDFNILITSNSRLWLKLDGDTSAWRRRLLIIEFTRPRTSRTIPEFAKRLLEAEGPGILNWMVQGAMMLLNEVHEHGGYVLTEAQRARIERLVSESNSVREFVANSVIAAPDGQVTTERLVEAYTQYCQARSWHALPAHTVERQLPDAMMEIHHAARSNDLVTGNSNAQRGYRGFGIRQEVGDAN